MDRKYNSQTILIWIVVITILSIVTSIICLLVIDNTKSVLEWISYIGSVMTLVGLAFTIYQLTVVKDDARAAETFVKQQIKNTLSTIDVTKAKLLIDFIIDNITAEKYELAYFRMVELNEILTKTLLDEVLQMQMEPDVSQVFGRLTTDINTVHGYIGKEKSIMSYDMDLVISNLHRIRNNVNKLSNYINSLVL